MTLSKGFFATRKIVVGICARDDEVKTITPCIESIVVALSGLPNATLLVCLNDYYDKIYEYLKIKHSNIEIITSSPGVISAQRTITNKYDADINIFVDADTTLEPDAITSLLDSFKNPSVLVAYGKNVPIQATNPSIIEKIYCLYSNQTFLTKRKYFHGRFFAAKKMIFPEKDVIAERSRCTKIPFTLRQYMNNGLVADDIYMSYELINKYGECSIFESKNSAINFKPITTLCDLYRSFRRTKIEISKCCVLFPEFIVLEDHLKRKTDWKRWYKSGGFERKSLWFFYLIIVFVFGLYLRFEMLFSALGIIKQKKQWEVLKTTK